MVDVGNVIRIQNAVKGLEKHLDEYKQKLAETEAALISSKEEYERPFAKEAELRELLYRQQELYDLLSAERSEKNETDAVEVVETAIADGEETVRTASKRILP